MYSDCLRCNRSLGRNTELARLPVGRRIAFDSTKARLWVVCPSCDQWNLVPIEERWEALEECEKVVAEAATRVDGGGLGVARTAGGIELLRANGISNADIANARYGHRIANRQRLLQVSFAALGVLAAAAGIRATLSSGSPLVGVYIGIAAAYWLFHIWRNPPRGWVRVVRTTGQSTIVWPWQLREVRLAAPAPNKLPELVLPGLGAEVRLRGDEAVDFLTAFLPKVNGADCVDASLGRAISMVSEAEAQGRRLITEVRRKRSRRKRPPPQENLRPWQRIAMWMVHRPLVDIAPEDRLALEMAVMEEAEQRELTRYAKSLTQALEDEGEIAELADDLLTPPQVQARLATFMQARSASDAAAEPSPITSAKSPAR